MNTTENNKLIAEFIGGIYENDLLDKGNWYFTIDGDAHCFTKLKYHTSLDWLMPVIEKIESINCVYHFDIQYDSKYSENNKYYTTILLSDKTTLGIRKGNRTIILSIYEAVVEFIKWYNENKED
jgi:hypothetical protein